MAAATSTHVERARRRIIIADDHRVIRGSLAGLLGQYADLEIVAEASDGRQAVDLARQFRPDVVIMDALMPQLNGVEATREIRACCPRVRIVALSMGTDDVIGQRMLQAGAAAYVSKDAPVDQLLAAIRNAEASNPAASREEFV